MTTVFLTPPVGRTTAGFDVGDDHPIYGVRPLLRGRFHQLAALASIPSGLEITAGAEGQAAVGAVFYAVTCTLMFATSAAYHRLAHSVQARFWMRRLDHAMILVHMAGASTAVALLGVGGAQGQLLMAAAWILALVGAGVKMTMLTSHRDPGLWFFGPLGLLPLLALPSLTQNVGWIAAGLLFTATCTYGAGAVCFARKSPDPLPMIFGFHEVWHVFTLIAAGFQFVLMTTLISAG